MFVVCATTFFGAPISKAYATGTCQLEVARVVSMQGIIELRRTQERIWQQASMDTTLCAGDMIRARSQSRAALRLSNDSMLRLDQRTSITFPVFQEEKGTSLLDLFEGAIHIITRTPKPFKIRTPFVNASVEGTEFFVGLHEESTRIVVYEGKVSASNALGSLLLKDHEAAITLKGQAPRKEIIIHPTDAVQWALYYPAVFDYWQDDQFKDNNGVSSQLHQAGRLLVVGQADKAKGNIQQVLQLEPGNSDAYALLAIIAVVQNDKDQALDLATKAVTLNSDSAVAHLALSYTQQAHFEITAALESVQKAITLDPQNALAWARSAELQMSLGDLDLALDAAQHAVHLNPDLAKTQTILGFSHLLQIDTKTAKTIFTQAIALDQADPMPRLGLGLALIREGELEAGRIELEIAASLDPANSLIRSYLGKAYFEEKRYTLAGTQFDLAKERDPKDPTPWFYDAIQKQTQNRPIEALQDIQKSIELNNNRAVYRSKFLLDRDEAARGSSLARIFENLGFERRAVMETAKSLSFDPANHSAHRFLSDSYTNKPGHEIARVSELLQAQLLQPINVNPVQPHMAIADLNIITNTGPSNPGFNEFAPLMERNKSQVVASGIVGNNGTLGNETVLSKLYERTSISLGQFHHETNGFRPNNNQNHNIYNAFIQHAFTPKFNVQAEVRTRDTKHGDLLLDGDPYQSFRDIEKLKLKEDLARIGARYALSPQQDFIVSGIYIGRIEDQIAPPAGEIPQYFTEKHKSSAYMIDFQHLYRKNHFNVISGLNSYQVSVDQFQQTDYSQWRNVDCSLFVEPKDNQICNLQKDFLLTNYPSYIQKDPLPSYTQEKNKGYIYTYFNFSEKINATLGLNFDSHKEDPNDRRNEFNPKFGLQTDVTDNIRLRLAWFETVKSALIANQTLEPTQVAGFNQLYDDINGTRAKRQGVGLDATISKNIYAGIEASVRHLHVPIDLFSPNVSEKQQEESYRTYVYWLPHHNWSVRSEPQYEKYTRAIRDIESSEPTRIDNFNFPINASYFNTHGVLANLTGTYVLQNLERPEEITRRVGIHDFFMLDTSIGYRLPKRRGIINFEVRNLLDEAFIYRSFNFQLNEYRASRFIPERTIFARFTLNF